MNGDTSSLPGTQEDCFVDGVDHADSVSSKEVASDGRDPVAHSLTDEHAKLNILLGSVLGENSGGARSSWEDLMVSQEQEQQQQQQPKGLRGLALAQLQAFLDKTAKDFEGYDVEDLKWQRQQWSSSAPLELFALYDAEIARRENDGSSAKPRRRNKKKGR